MTEMLTTNRALVGIGIIIALLFFGTIAQISVAISAHQIASVYMDSDYAIVDQMIIDQAKPLE